LERQDIARREGLPLTTVPRTLADVAVSGLAEELIVQATQEALQRGLTTPAALRDYARRRGGRGAELMLKTLDRIGAQ
jgi:hypothetical protein